MGEGDWKMRLTYLEFCFHYDCLELSEGPYRVKAVYCWVDPSV